MKKILVVDDDRGSREALRMVFNRDYELGLCPGAAEALQALANHPADLILMDVIMPDKDGLTLLREVVDLYPHIPVIMISASDNVRPVVESIKSGAVDFILKPFDVADLRQLVVRTLQHSNLQRRLNAIQSDLAQQYPVNGLIGESQAFVAVLDQARRAAMTDATILITGESGTGKEMIARQIHEWSARNNEPFVAVHCGALAETLMESELFGHEKGAFTGADRGKPGRFDLAAAGTLFFDEVAEMSLATQVKLLRVLQEREFMRVGGTKVIHTNARILAASNRDLKQAMDAGRFRDDLFYRLNVIPIHVPPLRERTEDIAFLTDFFLAQFRRMMNCAAARFESAALAALERYPWPGNVRELRNVIERILVLSGTHETISTEVLPAEFLHEELPPATHTASTNSLANDIETYERDMIVNALRQANGVQTRAAAALGTTRRILKYKMDKLNIRAEDIK